MKLSKLLNYMPDEALVKIKEKSETAYAGEVRNMTLETYRKFKSKKVLIVVPNLWIDGQQPQIFISVKRKEK